MGRYAHRKGIIIMKVSGESMNKVIPNGAYIGVNTSIDIFSINNGDLVVLATVSK